MADARHSPLRLCEYCQQLDVRKLLVASKAQGPPPEGRNQEIKPIHNGLPEFLKHHPDLVSLKQNVEQCDLCAAIWAQYSRKSDSGNISDEVMSQDSLDPQIWIGAATWTEGLGSLPMIVVGQSGKEGCVELAQFEAFACRGACWIHRRPALCVK
jgi:hypothetical protein